MGGWDLVSLAIGLVTGGFAARLVLEWTGRPWPWPLVVTLATGLAGTGALIAWRLRATRAGRLGWPLLLLAVYLIWPQRQLSLSLQLLTLVGLVALLSWQRRAAVPNLRIFELASRETWADGLTCLLSLSIYVGTTALDVLPADSGEFQIVAPLLGVAHPPGYPLYTLLGRLFTLLVPFGPAAYRLNLLSALLGAGTLTLLGAATRRWARHLGAPRGAALVGGVATALTLGTATTFWAQAGVANIRMPTVFLAALGLYALARYATATEGARADRALGLVALALSLGLAHHASLFFLGFFFLVYLFLVDPRLLVQPRRWVKPLLVALLALLPVLYLPLRGSVDAPLAPPDLDTLGGFIHHVTAQGFEGDMFYYANAQDLPQRLALLPTLFRFQFNPALLGAAALGLLLLAWRERRLLTLLAGGLILHTCVSITYRAPQTVEYLMPAYLPLAILVGLATAWLLSPLVVWRRAIASAARDRGWAERLWPLATVLAAVVLLAGLLNGLDHGPSFFTLARDRSTRAAMESMLEQAPPEALILADWRWATPLWYLQWVEGQRPDVEVRYVYPDPVAGQEYGDTWRERIEAATGERPLLLTHAYDLPGYTLEPLGSGFWVHQRPHSATPTGMSPLDAVFAGGESSIRLLGYRLSRVQVEPGQTLELTLAWQPAVALTSPPSVKAQLFGQDGRPRTQTDLYLGADYAAGEVRFERLVLPLYPDLAPGDYRLAVEVYSASEGGFETWQLQDGAARLDLTTLSLHSATTSLPSLHPLSVPFDGGPTLVGVDYDRTVPTALRLYLHWRGPTQGGEQVRVTSAGVSDGTATARLPLLSTGAYHTVVLDLPGEAQGQLRLALTGADGQHKPAAGPWGWSLRELRLPDPTPAARFVPLGDAMALVGATLDGEAGVVPGTSLTLRLDFLALKPLVDDYGVSVRLLDGAGGLRDMHDLQPALGAIPTLKWIRGSRVTDPHPLQVPDDLDGGTVKATLVVYERFRGSLLLPLDGRMRAVPLGEWRVMER